MIFGQKKALRNALKALMENGARPSGISDTEISSLINELHSSLHDLRLQLDEREKAAQKLNFYVNRSGVGLWNCEVVNGDIGDPNTRWYYSPELRGMLGYPKTVKFDEHDWAAALHPTDAPVVFENFQKHVADKTGSATYDVTYRCKHQKDGWRWFRSVGGTSRDIMGTPLRIAGSFIDVHETKTQELQIEQAQADQKGLIQLFSTGIESIDDIACDVKEYLSSILDKSSQAEELVLLTPWTP